MAKSATAGNDVKSADELEAGDKWLDDFLPYQLFRVTSMMNLRIQGRLRAIGVNLSQWRVMSVLRSHGRMSLSHIVERTMMEQPTVSRVVAQLEEEGLAGRRTSAADSRIVEVALTDKGAATFNDIVPSAFRHQRAALEGFDQDELTMLRALLRRIEKNIEVDR
ncbi:MarR family winged helix-turn-helix transcriptional regulator [Sphingobium boeckii]|uniref:DNA-binding MarR family transcriptional regulator n=1 Tax=Sphingobium boeckii TaxID=1082345 RepID=A0A7W9AFX3_9SPHN|nr:MarR family winged helix-turn-helix transcriptional regulator [Sphingobium boeckii]MBB5684776.1 DNA-binding MarR family transcriptional regulator [Sphingobium boeckii]